MCDDINQLTMQKVNKLEEFILDEFGTRDLCAKKLRVSRWTIYRWIERPDAIQYKHLRRLSEVTNKDICSIVSNHINNQ